MKHRIMMPVSGPDGLVDQMLGRLSALARVFAIFTPLAEGIYPTSLHHLKRPNKAG